MLRTHAREAVVREPIRLGVERMDLHERLGPVCAEAWAQARSCHTVPLIAQAAGIEMEWKLRVGRLTQRGLLQRDEARLTVRGGEAAVGEQAFARCSGRR